MHFIVGTITASLLSLSVWLLGFESLIDGVCNSSVRGDSCCFRLKFHLCICKKRDLEHYHLDAAIVLLGVCFLQVNPHWLGQELFPVRALSPVDEGLALVWQFLTQHWSAFVFLCDDQRQKGSLFYIHIWIFNYQLVQARGYIRAKSCSLAFDPVFFQYI